MKITAKKAQDLKAKAAELGIKNPVIRAKAEDVDEEAKAIDGITIIEINAPPAEDVKNIAVWLTDVGPIEGDMPESFYDRGASNGNGNQESKP